MKHLPIFFLYLLLVFCFTSCTKEQRLAKCQKKGYYAAKVINDPNDAFFNLDVHYSQYWNESTIRVDMDSLQADGTIDDAKGSLFLPLSDRLVIRGNDLGEYFEEGECLTDYVLYDQYLAGNILGDTLYWYTDSLTYTIPLEMGIAILPQDTIIHITTNQSAKYYWTGSPLDTDEYVQIRIRTEINDSTTLNHTYNTNAIGATSVQIPLHTLYEISGFLSSVSLTRWRTYYIGQEQIPYASGRINLEYTQSGMVLGVW